MNNFIYPFDKDSIKQYNDRDITVYEAQVADLCTKHSTVTLTIDAQNQLDTRVVICYGNISDVIQL